MGHRSHRSLAIATGAFVVAGGLALSANAAAQSSPSDWTEPLPPFAIADGLYYVGSKGLASYLVTTPAGHVLINSNVVEGVPLIRASVEQLGFEFEDIEILLISHAHFDHCGGSAAIKAATGARYMVMEGDAAVVESGGEADFAYGADAEARYPAAKVDRVLHDGDVVELGGARLVAQLTPGHTKGCTTWTLKARPIGEPDRMLDVVIVGSPNVNPGYKLVNNPAYWEIAADFDEGFSELESLPCDLFLGAHGSYFGLEEKFARRVDGAGTTGPFVDGDGYKAFVAAKYQAFRDELARQVGALPVKADEPRVEIVDDSYGRDPGPLVQLRFAPRDEDAAFLAELYDFAVSRFGSTQWGNSGPDADYREIVFFSRGRKVHLESWHPIVERWPNSVAASFGVTSLEGQDREAFLAADDPAYVAKRKAFDEIADRLRAHYGR